MPHRQRSPQEKKHLSLERDHPLWAKYPKSFRKHWPQKVARAERSYRHAQKQALATEHDPADVYRPVVRKWVGAAAPLGEVIVEKKARRARLASEPRKSPAARARRARRRGARQPTR